MCGAPRDTCGSRKSGGGEFTEVKAGTVQSQPPEGHREDWQEGGKTAHLCWAFFQHGLGSGGLY